MNLPDWYREYKELIEKSIIIFFDDYFKNLDSRSPKVLDNIKEGIYYACKWWKRIRSILALEFYLILTWKSIDNLEKDSNIIKYCISLEIVHAFSLVHDDLPCMDNDEYRRGELTVWKKYGEANALLVWDTLNIMAFELLWNMDLDFDIKALIKYFWNSLWLYGMCWWQVLDLYYERKFSKLDLDKLIEIHNRKTWALIEASIVWWILISQNVKNLEKYKKFWKIIWLAFQIKDDLLDLEWNFEETGKSVWWEKKWFVYFIWVEKSRKYLNILIKDAKEIIKELSSEKLEFICDYIANRKK